MSEVKLGSPWRQTDFVKPLNGKFKKDRPPGSETQPEEEHGRDGISPCIRGGPRDQRTSWITLSALKSHKVLAVIFK